MTKVLFLSAVYCPQHVGGAEVSTQILAEALADMPDYEVAVVCNSASGADDLDMINNVRVLRHDFPDSHYMFASKEELARRGALEKLQGKIYQSSTRRAITRYYLELFSLFDVVVISGNASCMCHKSAWEAAWKLGKPMVHILRDPVLLTLKSYRATNPLIDGLYAAWASKGIERLDAVVGPTQAILDAHSSKGIRLPSTRRVIPNPVDDRTCRSVPFAEKEQAVIFVGSVTRNKGVITLVDAFELADMPGASLQIAGGMGDVDLNGRDVELLGHLSLEEAYAAMARSKLLVLPSEWEEAFGRVLVESVFNGTVCVGSDKGGIPEVLGHDTFFIFPAGDARKLAVLMERIMAANEDEYMSYLMTEREFMARYRPDAVASEWDVFLKELLPA